MVQRAIVLQNYQEGTRWSLWLGKAIVKCYDVQIELFRRFNIVTMTTKVVL